MDYKKQLTETIENFYINTIEEFKELELYLIADSKFKNIFKKKDYDGNLKKLRDCKRSVLKVSTDNIKIPENDGPALEIQTKFEHCILGLIGVCDAYIQLQEALKRKSEGRDLKYSEYKEIFNKVQARRDGLNGCLHELDIVYTDFTAEDDPYTFL